MQNISLLFACLSVVFILFGFHDSFDGKVKHIKISITTLPFRHIPLYFFKPTYVPLNTDYRWILPGRMVPTSLLAHGL